MATTADFRIGMCLDFNDEPWLLVGFQHVKPGKGGAFVRTRLKNLNTGNILEHTFNSGVKINPIRVEKRAYQFLYKDHIGYHFMQTETFEQITIEKSMINAPQFLKEGNEVDVLFHADGNYHLSCDLPTTVALEVTYTEPGIKEDTSTNALKPPKLETGNEIKLPLFINPGDKVKIDTRTGEYLERYKE